MKQLARFRFVTIALMLQVALMTDAVAQTANDVKRIADWVREEGRPSTISKEWLPFLGLGPETGDAPLTRNRSFRVPDDNNASYGFSLLS